MTVKIEPDRRADHLGVPEAKGGDTSWLAPALEAAARLFTKQRLEIRFQIGPRRGQLTAVQLFAAAKALRNNDSHAAHKLLTSAIGLPSRLIELDTLTFFLDDVAGAAKHIPQGHFLFVTKPEFKSLRLAGSDPLYGDAGAPAVQLESRAPATAAPKAGAARRGPGGGVAAGIKSGRISRAFNPRASDRARHASLRGQAQTFFDRMVRMHPSQVGAHSDEDLMQAALDSEHLAGLLGEEAFGDTLAQLTERQLRDGLFGTLGRWRPRYPEDLRSRLVNRWVEALVERLPGQPFSKAEGPGPEVVATLMQLLAPMTTRDTWDELPQHPELQACLALTSLNELRDIFYNSIWSHRPGTSRADRITRVKALTRDLEDSLGNALAERMRTEAVQTFRTATEALQEEASQVSFFLDRLHVVVQEEGPLGKVLLTAFGLGEPSNIAQAPAAAARLQALARELKAEGQRLSQLTAAALRDEVRVLPQAPDRLERAFGAVEHSALAEALPRFFAPLDGARPPWQPLADVVVGAGALALGTFVEHDPAEGNPCGALAAVGTEVPKLLEADVCKRLGGGGPGVPGLL